MINIKNNNKMILDEFIVKKHKKIESIEDYISIIKDIYSMEGSPGLTKIYYRGQSNCKYKIIPSLSHCLEKYKDDECDEIDEIDEIDERNYISYEKEIIERAKLEYPQLFRDSNSIDELALMQHYGLPTRLMDVTENPLVALYFACVGNEKHDGEVFVFCEGEYAKSYTSYDETKIHSENKIAFVRAKIFSDRQRVQQGLFMWFPDEKLMGIEKDTKKSPIINSIIIIPSKIKPYLLNELKMVGISSKSLFPDNIDLS